MRGAVLAISVACMLVGRVTGAATINPRQAEHLAPTSLSRILEDREPQSIHTALRDSARWGPSSIGPSRENRVAGESGTHERSGKPKRSVRWGQEWTISAGQPALDTAPWTTRQHDQHRRHIPASSISRKSDTDAHAQFEQGWARKAATEDEVDSGFTKIDATFLLGETCKNDRKCKSIDPNG